MSSTRLAIMTWILLTHTSTAIQAAPPGRDALTAKRPERLTVTVGDILIRIDGPKLWTLSGIDYQQSIMAVQASAYGTVVNIRGVGALGSAHFLDVPDKPGAVEKEDVLAVRLLLDEQPVADLTPTMSLTGQSFRMERESKIRGLHLNSSVTLRDGVLMETVRLRTAAAVDLRFACPFMYAWTPTMTGYLFGDDGGIQKRGVFLGEPAKPAEGMEKSSCWMAVYDPRTEKGAVCYIAQQPPAAVLWLQYTDGPGVYRKLRPMSFVEQIMPAGFDGTYQSAVGFFQAQESDWEAAAQRRLTELKLLAKTLSAERE